MSLHPSMSCNTAAGVGLKIADSIVWRKAPIFQAQARGQRGGGGKTADYLKSSYVAFLLDHTLRLLVYKAARRNQLCHQ